MTNKSLEQLMEEAINKKVEEIKFFEKEWGKEEAIEFAKESSTLGRKSWEKVLARI